jgi:hypothetical protein
MVVSSRSSMERQMPPEAVIFVTAVVGAFSLLMGTLGWVMWYTRDTPRPVPRD